MEYSDEVTCPKCLRGNVKVELDSGRMVSHAMPGDGIRPRPRCRASKRRPENALITGSLPGRGDLRLKR